MAGIEDLLHETVVARGRAGGVDEIEITVCANAR
jgi:hypothetical protein